MFDMLKEILNQELLLYVIVGICGVGVVSNLITSFLYRGLVKDAKNMVMPKRKFLKEMKTQFESNYKLNESINNIQAFIDKWMCKYKFMGLNLRSLKRISSYAMVGCLVAGAASGTYLASLDQFDFRAGFNFYGAGIASFLILLAVRGMTDLTYKEEVVVLHVKDFLENSMVNRLGREIKIEKEVASLKVQKENQEIARKNARVKPAIKKPEEQVTETVAVREARQIPIKTIKPVPLKTIKPINPVSKEVIQPISKRVAEKLSKKEVDENVARMRESMNQIAAGNEEQREKNREILKSMDTAEQEQVIREILKEYLS